ncbi:MAG: 50S ribosomal protein L25 [Pelolinea sp.]|nr:50S ribosomal protein L25 [Pelolinea sp.]
MEKIVLEAQVRNQTGKKVKFLRKEGLIPAVIYGREIETLPISLKKRETTLLFNKISSSTILTINVDGKEHATLVREVQRDYIKNELLHIDIQAISVKEKLRTHVSLTLVGKAPVLENFDALIVSGIDQIEVECLPQDLVDTIEVDVSSLAEIGSAIYVKDLPKLANVEILTDLEELVAVANAVKEEVEPVAEEVVSEEGAAVEPEVIEKGKIEEPEEE